MAVETKAYVIGLLESYNKRMNQIALLHYELEHPTNVSPNEMIGAMSLGHGDGTARSKGHISNKTLYIALNYQEQADLVNSEAREEIVERLIELEREQEKLAYYITLLNDKQKETVIHGETGYLWNDEMECVELTKNLIDDDAMRKKFAVAAVERSYQFSIDTFYKENRRMFHECQL